jgi:hypothetical protein
MLIFDCDNVNSASVANPLSNEELNDSKLVNLVFTDDEILSVLAELALICVLIDELNCVNIALLCENEVATLALNPVSIEPVIDANCV